MNDVRAKIDAAPISEFEPKAQPDADGLSEDEEALLDELAGLSPVLYARRRNDAAKKLGIGVSALDKGVEARRPRNDGDPGQGHSLGLDDPEPWPEPVDGDALLDEIVMRVRRYIVLPDGAAEVLALWAIHAHAYEAFYYTPRLAITAPEKGCGKTIVLDVLQSLTPRSIRTENITTAVLFRLVDSHRPTLLVDEFDTFLKNSDDLRGAINAGHRRGGVMLRCEGDENEVRGFKTFAPVALAGIGNLPGTIADRSISISMRRALPDEPIQPFRGDRADTERDLCRKIARWVSDNRVTLERHEPDMPGWMFNRQADNWRPLFAIADIAGGDWPGHARAVAERICGGADEETSTRVQLLKDIGDLFNKFDTDQLSSATIAQELGEMEERPWPDWGKAGKPITKAQIARQLKPFGISPKNVRIEGKIPKGYKLAHLEDALRRYGGSQSATPLQVNKTGAFRDFQTATTDSSVAFQNDEKPKETADCSGVAVRTGDIANEGGITIDPVPVDDEIMEWTG